LHNQGITRNI